MFVKLGLPPVELFPVALSSQGIFLSPFKVIEDFSYLFWLFTRSDFKTILVPVTTFACLSTSGVCFRRVLPALWWTWLHLLQFCVSNQCLDPAEDALNKPWRPIPSGFISIESARILRWALLPICLHQSFVLGVPVQGASLALVFLTHNELGYGSHWFMRTVCNAWGYAFFNAGAVAITSINRHVETHTIWSFCCNAAIILTTIHAQDFRDEDGDKLMGRKTLPIVWPHGSRIAILASMLAWSVGLVVVCRVHFAFSVCFCTLAAIVGMRFYSSRSVEADRRSYQYYNIWLAAAQVVHTPVIMALLRS